MKVWIRTRGGVAQGDLGETQDALFKLDIFLKLRTIELSDIESFHFRIDRTVHVLHTDVAIALEKGGAMARLLNDRRIAK